MQLEEVKEDLGQGISLEMVLIPAGKFVMGSPESEKDRYDDETQHEVTLTKPYYMGKYAVTQEQWDSVMGDNRSSTNGAKLPVGVSWDCCQKFIEKLNAKTSGGYRLPTEAEWEYACRAGTTTAFSVGDSLTDIDANIDVNSRKAVGSYKPNAFGLYDMHGNAWEWCEDWYARYPEGPVTDPKGLATGADRVLRGGIFDFQRNLGRSASRFLYDPDGWIIPKGFRLARTVDIKTFEDAVIATIEKELTLIPAGKFVMGSPNSEGKSLANLYESQHEVTITKPYFMGKYEVTQEQWEAVMGVNPSATKGAWLPVTNVSWVDCQEFIKRLNAKTDGRYRLPTEAEWEYACRAGTTTAFSFGAYLTKRDACIENMVEKPEWSEHSGYMNIQTIPDKVGSYRPNAFGLYDMHGNVYEWCEDWFEDYYGGFPRSPVTDPVGSATPSIWGRIKRGGTFKHGESHARSAGRNFDQPEDKESDLGFRLARTMNSADLIKSEIKPSLISEAEIKPSLISEAEIKLSLISEAEIKLSLISEAGRRMVLIPAGTFIMGSPESEKRYNETQHEVTITKPFYIGKYEVTQEHWVAVMGNNPSRTYGANLPVTDVSWEDCQEFIEKLNSETEGGYRLPTEAEWEYACRAGTTTAYSCGVMIVPSLANFKDSNVYDLVAVGSYKPNAFGLYDMHGNVCEWCEDWNADYPAGGVTDPKGPGIGKLRVTRGGSFQDFDWDISSASRGFATPTNRHRFIGFRLARTVDIKTFEDAVIATIEKELTLIPAGKFVMGSPESEVGHTDYETQHEVTITKFFCMGKYAVTQNQWEGLGLRNRSYVKGEKLPVTNVSWEDCQKFIAKLNARTDGRYRLPTDAEWEYSCRAGTTTAYSFGDELMPHDANYSNINSKLNELVAVGSYKPNAFGLYDMHGNVWEWCEDWLGENSAGLVIDPKGPATGDFRVLRGGSFEHDGSYARSSYLCGNAPSFRGYFNGFRLARTVDIKTFEDAVIATIEKELTLIPAGKFVMGSPETEEGRSDDETQHEVTLTKPYYMGKYEVTQEQWEALMGNNRSFTKGAKLPVTDVSWEDCQEFIKKLNEITNGGYRLPTEAEWEYACRAGTTTAYSVGDANYGNDGGNTKVVGSFKPNAFGLYDMHGNVSEWCEDWYAKYPEGPITDPKGPATGERSRVLRGGSFDHDQLSARSSARNRNSNAAYNCFGFRLARTP